MSWILWRSICRPTLGSQIGDDASEWHAKICPRAWSKKGSGGGEMDPAALPLSGFLPLYILVRAFLISQTQLSQNLEQTKASGIERVGISLIEVYGGVGKSVTSVRSPWLLSTHGLLYRSSKWPKWATPLRILRLWKSRLRFIFKRKCIYYNS